MVVNTIGAPATIDGPAAPLSAMAAPPAVRDAERAATAPIASISIVIPVFNEEGNLRELHRRLSDNLAAIGLPYEVVFVDDGSRDGTWATIRELADGDPHLVAIRHRRNFGKARALASGFAAARGDAVVTMDGDLQDDPDELARFVETLNDGYDVVSGWKQHRQDPLGKTFPSRIFNASVRRVSGVPLHDFNCGYKAYRLHVVRTIRIYGELHRFTPVLAYGEGFSVGELPVRHHPRTWGTSKYGWSRLTKGFFDLLTVTFLTQYRQRPMHLFGLPGLIALAIGVAIGLFLTAEKVFTGEAIGTRPLLLLGVLLVVIGAQFFGLGLLGELLAHGAQSPEDAARTTPLREAIGVGGRPSAPDGASGLEGETGD